MFISTHTCTNVVFNYVPDKKVPVTSVLQKIPSLYANLKAWNKCLSSKNNLVFTSPHCCHIHAPTPQSETVAAHYSSAAHSFVSRLQRQKGNVWSLHGHRICMCTGVLCDLKEDKYSRIKMYHDSLRSAVTQSFSRLKTKQLERWQWAGRYNQS